MAPDVWGRKVWPPGPLVEDDASTGIWQMLAPVADSDCDVFGTNELVSDSGWSGGRVDPEGDCGLDDMMNAMVAAANSAIASLPALILQRANPGLYDLFQNALLQAEETLQLATKSCEQMEAEIAAGKSSYADLLMLSKGNDWKVQMGIGGKDAVSAKESVEEANGENGVPWIGGQAGGSGLQVLEFTGDIVPAGYNIHMIRPVTSIRSHRPLL